MADGVTFPTMGRETNIDPRKLDPTRRRIWDLLQRKGVDMKAASSFAGRADTYIRDFLIKGTPDELPEKAREGLGAQLAVNPDYFRKNWRGTAAVDIHNHEHPKGMVAGANRSSLGLLQGDKRTRPAYEAVADQGPIIGRVQSGAWKEAYQTPEEEWTYMPLPADDRFTGIQRYLLESDGESMNRVCPPGGKWVFVFFEHLNEQPSVGQYVIVERHRGDLVEATAKQYRLGPDGKPWLFPDSTDPSFKPFPADDGSNPDNDPDGTKVVIVGRVTTTIGKKL